MQRLHQRRQKRRGFTLMEVLLVLAILGVILAMVVPQLLGRQRGAQIQAAYNNCKALENVLEMYALDHDGNFPSTAEGTVVLVANPGNDDQWKGPYLKNTNEVPLDPWQQPMQYAWPGNHNQDKPDVWSMGPDRQDGTQDDIGNWMPPPR